MLLRKSHLYIVIIFMLIIGLIINHIIAGDSYSDNSVIALAILTFFIGYLALDLAVLLLDKEKNIVVFKPSPRQVTKSKTSTTSQPVAQKKRRTKATVA